MIANSVLLFNANNSTIIDDTNIWTSLDVFTVVLMLSLIEFYLCMEMYFFSYHCSIILLAGYYGIPI